MSMVIPSFDIDRNEDECVKKSNSFWDFRQWHPCMFLVTCIRFLSIFQTAYVHPDEFFQSQQVIASLIKNNE